MENIKSALSESLAPEAISDREFAHKLVREMRNEFVGTLLKIGDRVERLEATPPRGSTPPRPREWKGAGDPPCWWGLNLAERLACAQAEMKQPPKNGTMKKFRDGPTIPYVKNDDLCEVVRAPLGRWGVTMAVEMVPFNDGSPVQTRQVKTKNGSQTLFMVKLQFVFTDGVTEMKAYWLGEGADIPIACTYAEKYYLAKRFMLGGGDGDDELAAQTPKAAASTPAVALKEAKRKTNSKPKKSEAKPAPVMEPEPEESPVKKNLWVSIQGQDGVYDENHKLDNAKTMEGFRNRVSAWLKDSPDICAVDANGEPALRNCTVKQMVQLQAKYDALHGQDPTEGVKA